MKKENIVMIVLAFVVGVLLTLLVVNIATNKGKTVSGNVPVGAGSPLDYQQRIAEGEKIVAQDPKNFQVWVQLGNDYFDTDQPEKAIHAYGQALALNPDNPNILTDQGVMFKRLGEMAIQKGDVKTAQNHFMRAIANFEKAQAIDPSHMQSLYNMGIVYYMDLHRNDKAIETWNRYLKLDSTSPQSQQVKAMMEEMKRGSTPSFH